MNESPSRPAWRPTLLGLALACALASARAEGDLTSMSLEQLMDLRVVGASKYEQKQSEVAAAVSVLTREDIRNFGWRTVDQALASLPGVHTTYDRQYSYLGTRGFGVPGDFSTRVLITINGNRVNDSLYDGGPMGRQFPLDMDLVERIEFIPGPGGAVYGQNAMFGVVNVVTIDGAGLGGTELALRAQAPQHESEGRASWGGRLDGGFDVLLSVAGMRARGEDRDMDFGSAGVSGIARGLDGSQDRELFVRVARESWSFDLIDGRRRKDDPTGAYFSDPLVPDQSQGDHYTLAQGQFRQGLLDDALQLDARVFAGRERYRSRLRYGSWYAFPGDGGWRGAELRALYTGLAGHKLMLGVEAQHNHLGEQRILDEAQPANDITIQSPGWRAGVYAQDEWQLAEGLHATLGLRVDRNKVNGTETSPRAALIWQPTPQTTLKALFGRAHRAPNAYERDYDDGFAQVGNPGLRGEGIDTLELVADQRVGGELLLRASVYRWSMRDLISLGIDPASELPQYRNGARVDARGLELSADKTWSWGGRLRASVSAQRVRDARGAGLLNSPSWLGKLSFSTPLPLAGLRLGYELQADSNRRTIDGSRSGGYGVSNLNLRTERLAPGLSVGVGVQNLFDKRYAHPAADSNWQNTLEQDGRSLSVDLRWTF